MEVITGRMLNILPDFKQKLYFVTKCIVFPFRFLEGLIPKKASIIEVGCSYGLTSAYLALASRNRKIVGLDNNNKRIESANVLWKNVPNVTFRANNLLDKISIKKSDIVMAVDLLHHVTPEQQQLFLRDCYKRFGRNNILIIKEIDTKPFLKLMLNYLGDLLMNPGKFHYINSADLKKDLERKGFYVEYVRIRHLLYPHYLIICKKM
jgi:2-polyprenyl-3-methyl-5-hydroxy-6-metoxy-1,4-benzoquinol methylase